MRLPAPNRHVPPRQRGVFGLMAVGLMMLMVISVALALDTGRLFLEQRHMQRVADLAALEAAGAEPLISRATDSALEGAAREAARRNGHDSEESGRTLITVGGGVCHASEGDADGKVRVFFPLGHDDPSVACSDGHEGTLERHAVEVTASHEVRPSLFGSLLGGDDITISATAMAQRSQAEEYAVFSVGSRLLSVDTDDSILASLVGGFLEADAAVVGFDGIADATVTLSDLIDAPELGVGSAEELLSAELTLLDLVEAVVTAVDEDGTLGLDVLAGLLGDLPVSAHLSGATVTLGEVLGVTTDTIPLMAELDVPELLSTALLVASQGNAVKLPGLNLSVPGVTNIEAMLEVIEPPQIAIGPAGCIDDADPPCAGNWKTEAHTAQLTLGLGANVNIPILANLGVKLGVTAAGARAGIEDAEPADGGEGHKWDVDVAAYNAPLTTALELQLGLLDSYAPWFDDDEEDHSRIEEVESFLGSTLGLATGLVTNLVSGLVNVVSGLVSYLLSALYDSYITSDGTQVCGRALLIIPVGCEPAPTLEDELETDGGETSGWQDDLDYWFESGESQHPGTPMSPPTHTLAWPSETAVTFEGSLEDTAIALGNLADTIDIRAELFGVDLGVSSLLSPLLDTVDAVVGNIVGSLAAEVVDPLLDSLGVNVSEAEVRVIDIDHRTGPPELL